MLEDRGDERDIKMENQVLSVEDNYRAQIAELKAQFVSEKEELTNLFLNKLKEVENYHKKMLHDLVAKSNADLDSIQAKYEEKISFLSKVHSQEVDLLQGQIEQLREALAAIADKGSISKKNSNVLSDNKHKM